VPVQVLFPPATASDIAAQGSPDNADLSTTYMVAGAAAVALVVVAVGGWAIRRRRIT
jgi:hypothetical protein